MNIIYQPAGKAKEYCKLAVNLYKGCGHGCIYCYAPAAIRQGRGEFYSNPEPRKDVIRKLEKDCRQPGDGKKVLMSFTSDPYQPAEDEFNITRPAIKLLKGAGYGVVILTKGGERAIRDFDLLGSEDYVGATLTFLDKKDSLEWEPGAAIPGERLRMLQEAKSAGIGTWASLEPVIDPEQTLKIIRETHKFIDLFKVGKLNYHARANQIDWYRFAKDVKQLLKESGSRYYLKKDLQDCMKTKVG